jgi:hypothetical protein
VIYTLSIVGDESDSLQKAKSFAATCYADVLSRSNKDLEHNLAVQRNQLSARGLIRSGVMLHGTSQLYAKHIDGLVLAKLEGLLEGYELHHVSLDEQLAASTVEEVMNLKDALVADAMRTASEVDRGGLFTPEQFAEQVQRECRVSRSSASIAVERCRLRPKEPSGPSVVYHVTGHGRVNVDSTDNSVNIVTVSQQEIFSKLRHAIEGRVPTGEEKNNILERVSALEAAQKSTSFAQRYIDFVDAAANHMTLITPFLPALTEMMRNWLGT